MHKCLQNGLPSFCTLCFLPFAARPLKTTAGQGAFFFKVEVGASTLKGSGAHFWTCEAHSKCALFQENFLPLRKAEPVVENIVEVEEQIVAFPITLQMVAVLVSQMRQETVEVIQPVLVERIKDRVADQMVDRYPGAFGHGGDRGSCAGCKYPQFQQFSCFPSSACSQSDTDQYTVDFPCTHIWIETVLDSCHTNSECCGRNKCSHAVVLKSYMLAEPFLWERRCMEMRQMLHNDGTSGCRLVQGLERPGLATNVRWKRCRSSRLSLQLNNLHEPRQYGLSYVDGQERSRGIIFPWQP